MQKMLLKGLTIGMISMSAAAFEGESDWVLRNDDDGVKVYTRSDAVSANWQYRSVGVSHASPEAISKLMYDVSAMKHWLYNSYDFEMLEELGPDSRLLRMKVKTPVMVQERDLILTQTFEKVSDAEYVVHLEGKPDAVPVDPDYVRIPYFVGTWHMVLDVATGLTTIELQGQVDPGGAVPAFVSNRMLTETPWQNVRAVRSISETGSNPYW